MELTPVASTGPVKIVVLFAPSRATSDHDSLYERSVSWSNLLQLMRNDKSTSALAMSLVNVSETLEIIGGVKTTAVAGMWGVLCGVRRGDCHRKDALRKALAGFPETRPATSACSS